LKFNVVDIEATGGHPDRTRLMEVAVYTLEDGKIVDEFSTVVNPGKMPDPYVQKLTGITPRMLRKAPKFEQVAARLLRMLQGGVLVAHGADFDYQLLKKEYAQLGYDLDLPYLCTLQLAREMFPGLDSHGLESLTRHLRIPVKHRHRAFGDAYATARIFQIMWQKDPALRIIGKHIKNAQGTSLAQYSPRIMKMLDDLPGRRSVVKLYDRAGDLLYVAYAYHPRMHVENILANMPGLLEQVARMDTDPVPGRLVGRVLTQWLRKQHQPPFSPYRPVRFNKTFPLANALLFDRGRFPYEQTVFLIQDGRLFGFAYVDLNWQTEDLQSLKERMTRLDDCPVGRKAVYQHWKNDRFEKIINLDEAVVD